MEFKDYYSIMGVSRDATQDEIKRAYRKLARRYHPDVSSETDAEARFKEIGEAYEVLKDPEKRAAYDQLGTRWRAGEEFRPPPDWDANFAFGGGGFTDSEAAGFSEFFESLFGHTGPWRREHGAGVRMRGQDNHAKILVGLEDAYHGATRMITLRVPELTPDGHVRTRERQLNVRIPKGIKPGQHIRLAGQGAPGVGGGPAGDLYLEIEFKPHRLLAPWEAALGVTVAVPTLGGTVDVKIPRGSVAGSKLRLKGRGLPGKPPGDQYAVLRIVTPPAKTAAAEALYRQMAKELAFNPRANLGV
jgi:curved DNA-binding protein